MDVRGAPCGDAARRLKRAKRKQAGIAEMSEKYVVIKYGGHAMEKPELASAFMEDVRLLRERGFSLLVVHGGGPQITALLKRLGIESRFEAGLRVTDEPTLDAVLMALAGEVNKKLAAEMNLQGVPACGICGVDGGLLRARQKNRALGLVGEVSDVNPQLAMLLLQGGFLPLVSPLALGEDGGILNVNADTAAGALAKALQADYFVLISDVPGVLDASGTLLKRLDRAQIERMRAEGVIYGGMLPKLQACLDSTRQALILDGRVRGALSRYLIGKEPLGTMIDPDESNS